MTVLIQLPDAVSRTVQFARERELVALTVLLVALPLVTGNWSLSTYILIYGLFAVAYNICLGETGVLTFGHAAFFGLGAYGTGSLLVVLDFPATLAWVGLAFGVLLAALGGLVIGGLALRRRGTYLALITLAFAQMLWFIAFQWRSVTGGDDGLVGVPTPALGLPGSPIVEFNGQIAFYALALVIFLVSMVLLRRVRNSHFGKTLNAIRENENRAEFLGYDTYRYRLGAFVVSAAFSGVAGALYPLFLNIVGLNTLHWRFSGEVIFFVLLGGVSTFTGPVLGAGIFLFIRDGISTLTEFWQLPVGLLFVVIVLYFPEGVLGTLRDYLDGTGEAGEVGGAAPLEEGAD
jgi:branched-chain amino acid transport system permease protein